jgi:pimeloyl-ACP methyl ester carboxylesterase
MHPETQRPIEAAEFVRIHGVEQWITIRGRDLRHPAILILPGPGGSHSVLAPFFAPWEEVFTLVQWDMPQAGVTHARHGGPTAGALTIDRLVRDGLAVSEWASRQLGGRQLALLGFSAGTIVGLNMVQMRPELFSAYVGTGQVTHWGRQDVLSYERVLESARLRGDQDAMVELLRIGPPPYPDTATDAIKARYSVAYTQAEAAAFAALPADTLAAISNPPSDAGYLPEGIRPDKDARAVATQAYDALRSEIVSFDAERLGLSFKVPMIFLQGEEDACTVTSEVEAYAAKISAPHKAFVRIKDGGHSPWVMRDTYLAALQTHLRPLLLECC